jgi:hypothetical protein
LTRGVLYSRHKKHLPQRAQRTQSLNRKKWNTGKNGIMEWWLMQLVPQYSNIPSFQFSTLSLCDLCELCG